MTCFGGQPLIWDAVLWMRPNLPHPYDELWHPFRDIRATIAEQVTRAGFVFPYDSMAFGLSWSCRCRMAVNWSITAAAIPGLRAMCCSLPRNRSEWSCSSTLTARTRARSADRCWTPRVATNLLNYEITKLRSYDNSRRANHRRRP